MNSKLRRGARKLKLMKVLGTSSKKIFKEGEKYFCDQCKHCLECFTGKGCPSELWHQIAFDYEPGEYEEAYLNHDFTIWKCWKPK